MISRWADWRICDKVQLRKILMMAPRRNAARFRPPDLKANTFLVQREVRDGAPAGGLHKLCATERISTTGRTSLSSPIRRCTA